MFIPRSVAMRRRGLVPDKSKKDGICESRWVPKGTTLADKREAKIKNIIDVFQRFAIKASRKFRARKIYATLMAEYYSQRRANPRFQWNTPNWGDAMYEAEQAEIRHMVSMTESQWHALGRAKIASYKKAGRDIMPLLKWFQFINEKRKAYMDELERILRG